MTETVSIGVAVYQGHAHIAEALQSIQNQTHREIDVLISVDGGDAESAEACAPFLQDSRFKLVVQPRQLGWADNISWLMAQNISAYWYHHPQDDLVDEDYVATLLAYAQAHPAASVVYSDIRAFGNHSGVITQQSVLGPPVFRQLTLLRSHHAAVAFRGLTRAEALVEAGGLRRNEVEDFSADTTWMASAACSGELHRIEGELYRKRYHGANVHTKWTSWPLLKRVHAWQVHCRDMFFEAGRVDATYTERRLLWCAALERLVSDVAADYLPVSNFTNQSRRNMLEGFFDCCWSRRVDIELLLDRSWPSIVSWSQEVIEADREPA